MGTEGRASGVVKWWDHARGYGAIATIKTEPWDIKFTFSRIEATGYGGLAEGQPVDVDYVRLDQDSFKYIATGVRPVTREK